MRSTVVHSLARPCAFVFAALLFGCGSQIRSAPEPVTLNGPAGRSDPDARYIPTGQLLSPAGRQIFLPRMRPQGLALSPDGRLLAVTGNTEVLLLLDPRTGQTLPTVPLAFISSEVRTNHTTNATAAASEKIAAVQTNTTIVAVTNRAEISLTGLIFSPDSRRIYLSNAKGNIWVFTVREEQVVGRTMIFHLPDADAPKQRAEIPSGLTLSADGRLLYVTGNLGNML